MDRLAGVKTYGRARLRWQFPFKNKNKKTTPKEIWVCYIVRKGAGEWPRKLRVKKGNEEPRRMDELLSGDELPAMPNYYFF